ncbi:MAG: DUF2924 domain-containing protein [Tepidiformaceae bacterium]
MSCVHRPRRRSRRAMAITNRELVAGTKLVGRYKGQQHTVLVVGDADPGFGYELNNGTIYKSLSAAGSVVMKGVSCNGWRFWSVEGDEAEKPTPKPKATALAGKLRQLRRVPNQKGVAEGSVKWFCSGCMASFLADTVNEPQACPNGHPRMATDELATMD